MEYDKSFGNCIRSSYVPKVRICSSLSGSLTFWFSRIESIRIELVYSAHEHVWSQDGIGSPIAGCGCCQINQKCGLKSFLQLWFNSASPAFPPKRRYKWLMKCCCMSCETMFAIWSPVYSIKVEKAPAGNSFPVDFIYLAMSFSQVRIF